ncbi:MAG: hypothetical protein FJX57_24030 [Alphaproteobacteria bacterium]|nr:hypothetical protein [Alphaproteobacteria bacterium]
MKELILTGFVGAAALLSTGCENKVGQCNALIKVLNDAQGKIKPGKADPAAFETLAGDLEVAAGEVAKAEVKLPELKKFRDDYKQLLLDTAKGMRDASAGAKAGDIAKLGAAARSMSDMGTRVGKVTKDITEFCNGK